MSSNDMELKFCSNCVMDGSAEELVLDENGVCNFCHQAQRSLREIEAEKVNLPKILEKIKKAGKGKKYNCLIGCSGGVDSSTALVNAVKFGLRPLVISMDNGYNTSMADENVLKIVETLKVPFYRYVLDLNKFRDLQAAYLKAGVINIEAIYDNLLAGAIHEIANIYKIRWIISGGNVSSESIMPSSWSYRSSDLVNMRDIYRKMTGRNLKRVKGSFPLFGLWDFNYYKWLKRIKTVYLLDYL